MFWLGVVAGASGALLIGGALVCVWMLRMIPK